MSRPVGRPPTPLARRRVQGNPGKRPIPANAPEAAKPAQMPPTPLVLKDAGRESWRLYWTYGRAWLAYTDIPMVTRLCRITDRAAEMEATLDEEGLLHRNPKTRRSAAHFLLNQLLGVYKAIADLESVAGFTPTDRARMKAEPIDEGDEVDRWMKGTG